MPRTTLHLTTDDLEALGLKAQTGAAVELTDSQLKTVLGARLQRALDRRNMTQADLSRRLGCGRSVVSRWCDGTNMIGTRQALTVAALLGMSHDEWLPDVDRRSV